MRGEGRGGVVQVRLASLGPYGGRWAVETGRISHG